MTCSCMALAYYFCSNIILLKIVCDHSLSFNISAGKFKLIYKIPEIISFSRAKTDMNYSTLRDSEQAQVSL